jgi:hypothetical protein
MGSSQRLHKIETTVTPRQAALLWINEAHAHSNMEDYVKWLSENPAAKSPNRFVENAIDAFEKSADNQKPEDQQKVVTQARQEYVFLYHLFLNINSHVMKTVREKSLWVQLLLERLGTLKSGLDEVDLEEVSNWKKLFFGFYGETYVETRAFKVLNQKYYPGHEILFSDLTLKMESLERVAKILLESFNVFCNGREDLTPIDLSAFENQLQPHLDQKVKDMADLAKAEVLVTWGRREAGASLIKKQVLDCID